jgi:MscS family membrane protein
MKYIQHRLLTAMLCFTIILFSEPVRAQSLNSDDSLSSADSTISTSKGDTLAVAVVPTMPSLNTKEWSVSFSKIFVSLMIILIVFIIIRYVTRFIEMLGERWGPFRLLVKRLVPIIRISGWTIVLYFIIAVVIAPPIETLIAVTASAGIAIGFASQDILKNIFGGIMILFDRPFQVGDKIGIGNHYGEVIQIGLRTVRIVTADDSVVSIPNGEIVNQSVSNSNSGEFNCQVVSEFYLPADIDLLRLKKICFLAAAVSRYAYLKKPIAVIIKNEITEGRSLFKIRLKAYVFDIRYEFAFASEMTELVMNQVLKEKLVSPDSLSYFKNELE